MRTSVNNRALDQIFRKARSQNGWKDEGVSDTIIYSIYDLLRMGPTSVNSSPARFLFLKSDASKERLKPHLMGDNVEKVMTAPVCAIIAHDLEFFEKLDQLYPNHPEITGVFVDNKALSYDTAFRNGTLQGAYFMVAARSLGLDCGPISGFNNEGVDQEFFPEGKIRSNFLCSIGVGDETKVYDPFPRLSFEETCEII